MEVIERPFKGKVIRTVVIGDDSLYPIRDIARALNANHSGFTELVNRVGARNVMARLKGADGKNHDMRLVSKADLERTLLRSQLKNCHKIASFLNLNLTRFAPIREQRTLEIVVSAFSHINVVSEYKIGKYRVDLYFPDHDLMIECDEPQAHRNILADTRRQKEIHKRVECRIVRYNPDDPNFDIGVLIRKIMRFVYEGKLKPVKLSWLNIL